MTAPQKPEDIVLTVAPAGKAGRFVAVASHADATPFRDVIDLNSAHARGRFVRGALAALLAPAAAKDAVECFGRHLDARLLAYAAAPPGVSEAPPATTAAEDDPRAAELANTPADVRAAADELLADPELVERVAADIAAAGVVGERHLALTVYLVGVSAQLDKPLAAISRGASSSGKSYVIARVAELFPPEVVLHATALTPNALYYFPRGGLRHRWVVAGERSRGDADEHAEATRALREMLEAGRLSKALPVKENDQLVTRVVEQDGPIAYVESTTAARIDDEDANRCLLLATDESQEQTGRILAATARRAAGRGGADPDRAAVHHAVQRMLPRCAVVIPFAEEIAHRFDTARLEARRDFRHLLQLVKAVALLHFRQRERGTGGAVVATLYDYAQAATLARGPLGAAASGVGPAARTHLAALRAAFGEQEFSTAEAKPVGSGSERTKYNRLCELNSAGAVEQTVASKGRVPARWRLTGVEPDAGAGSVPTVFDVEAGCVDARQP